MLDNNVATLLALERHGAPPLRRERSESIERLILQSFSRHEIYFSIANAVELVGLRPSRRAGEEQWFQTARERLLIDSDCHGERSELLAQLYSRLEAFYTDQNLPALFLERLNSRIFRLQGLGAVIRSKVEELRRGDLQRRLCILFSYDDLFQALTAKNAETTPDAAVQALDAIIRSEAIRDHPSILRLIAALYSAMQTALTGRRYVADEFGLKDYGDILDCELSSALVIGSRSPRQVHPVDAITLEESSDLAWRAMAIKLVLRGVYKALEDSLGRAKWRRIPFRTGSAYFLSNDSNPIVRVQRVLHIADMREGGRPRIVAPRQ